MPDGAQFFAGILRPQPGQSVASRYGRRYPMLSAWCAVALITREGVGEDGEPIDQRAAVKRLLEGVPKGGWFRNEIARRIMEIRRLEADQ